MSRPQYTPEQDAEHTGCSMGRDLLNDLLNFERLNAPQTYALRAIHDKLHALSKVEPFDNAAGGFAVALLNVLQIGIANLPKGEAEE